MSLQTSTRQYENLDAKDVIDRALAENRGLACITCSFQAEGMVVLSLLRKRLPHVPVLFLDTGYHFAETYGYRDRMTRLWDLNLVNLMPLQSVAKQESDLGILYQSNPGLCCQRRKVEPLMRALEPFDLWFTGLRREQSATRKNLKTVENHLLPSGKHLLKVNPLADWDWKRVWKYTVEHQIEYQPLYDEGFTSIGCEPCTSVPLDEADLRSGRWGGGRLECGIHTFSQKAE